MVEDQLEPPKSEWLIRAGKLSRLFLAEAALVNVFKGKWMIIINKSQLLSASLSSLAASAFFEQNAVLKDLLPSIVQMLEEGRELAKRCIGMNYGGKLLMQNNLDALAAKLDLYLRDLEFLVKSSILREASLETRTEAATLQVWDFFTRLKIGNAEVKKIILITLVDYLKEEEKALLVAEEGDIPYLIHLLDSSLAVIREKAAEAVSILAQIEECRQCLTIENVHAPLVRLLETGTPVAKEKAVEALLGLSYTREDAYALVALGGVSALVDLCRNGTPNAQAMAAGTIRNLANFEQMRKCLAEDHAIPVLINLVSRGTFLAQEYAAETLQNLACGDERFKLAIARHGGLQALLMYLQRSTSSKPQEIALGALRNLADCTANAKSLISAGYLRHLATILNNGTSSVQQLAASAICNLSACMDIRKALGEAGCIPLLVRMLEAKNAIEQEITVQELSDTNLESLTNCKEVCKEERGIFRLVHLLDPRNRNATKRFSISAWLAISNNNTCKKRILSAAGAHQHLENLAHVNVTGIRRTLDKIGSGFKLRNIFNRHKA